MATFSPEQKAVLYQGAEGIGGILKERWQNKQAEAFTSNELAKFLADSSTFNDTLNQLPNDPDSDDVANTFRQFGTNVFIPFLSSAAVKYGDNPKIMAITQRLDQEMQNQLSNFMKFQEMGQEQEKIDIASGNLANDQAVEKRKAEEAKVMGPLKVESEKALADSRRAQADLARARAGKLDQDQLPEDPAEIIKKARQMKGSKEREDYDKRTLEDIMARILSVNKNSPYPSGTGVWGSDPEEDRRQALEDLRRRGLFDDVVTAGRAAQLGGDKASIAQALYDSQIDPEAIQLVLPEVLGLREIPEEKMRGKLSDRTSGEDMVAVITGTPGTGIGSLQDYYDQVVERTDSFRNLPDPIRSVFTDIKVNKLGLPITEDLVKDDKGNYQIKPRQINNPEALKAELVKNARRRIIETMVDPKSATVQKDVGTFLDQLIEKFYPEVRRQFMSKEQIAAEEASNSPIERWLNTAAESLGRVPGAQQTKKAYKSLVRPAAEKAREVIKGLIPEDKEDFKAWEAEMARLDAERKRKRK